ncbi:hypothetical protein HA402_007442 [Bradysia odoriphaga]|nr:hypothetical protein HA402_007442 [Bradysia odoriphaga]
MFSFVLDMVKADIYVEFPPSVWKYLDCAELLFDHNRITSKLDFRALCGRFEHEIKAENKYERNLDEKTIQCNGITNVRFCFNKGDHLNYTWTAICKVLNAPPNCITINRSAGKAQSDQDQFKTIIDLLRQLGGKIDTLEGKLDAVTEKLNTLDKSNV